MRELQRLFVYNVNPEDLKRALAAFLDELAKCINPDYL